MIPCLTRESVYLFYIVDFRFNKIMYWDIAPQQILVALVSRAKSY